MAAPCGRGFISHTGEKERDRSQVASAMAMEREERWKRMKEMVRETNERVRGGADIGSGRLSGGRPMPAW